MNLTDNEIIKALECCGAGKYHCLGELCPKFRDNATTTVSECREVLMKDTTDLINRQKAEIERLKSDLTLKTYDYEHLLMKCKEIQAISSSRKDRLMQIVVKLQTARVEAIKEFVERLIHEIVNRPSKIQSALEEYLCGSAYRQNEIIDIIKEMESENNV
jgi:hypothetical protein